MKILFVNIPAGEKDNEFGRIFKNTLVPLWKRNIDLVKQKDTKVVFRCSTWGMGEMDTSYFRYMDHLASSMIYHVASRAEEEGFDAVAIACFGDPMAWELRQVLNIPVVCIGESSMLLSTLMGLKFGVVTISPFNVPGQEERIAKYGFKERSAGVRAIPESSEEQVKALISAGTTIEAFKQAARELIADGAEIVIPGCSLMSPALRLAPGAEKEYPDGVTEVDGVPIADVISDTVKLAETLVSLKNGGSSWISRKCLYAQATPIAKEFGKMLTEDSRVQYWDVE
jgi:Asp/Glu/hydantoin racemase